MNPIHIRLLEALKAFMNGEYVTWTESISEGDWEQLFSAAQIHYVLPMVLEAVSGCEACRGMAPAFWSAWKKNARTQMVNQAVRTEEFFRLNDILLNAGVKPLVVKGLICRNLYAKPDLRPSSDEDIFIDPRQFERCHEAMVSFGMHPMMHPREMEEAHEVPYMNAPGVLYVELHKSLFPPDSDAYGDMNRFFTKVFERAVAEEIQGRVVYTLEYTDHLFYLICHALKHFMHSGFGIRQVCDIVQFSGRFGLQIDWNRLLEQCRQIRGERFAAAVFRIGEKWLGFSPAKAGYPAEWKQIQADEKDLLEDLLESGVYGGADMCRKHSSTLTLQAVAADRGNLPHGKPSLLRTLFPSVECLRGRYPWLKKHPLLLPAAWADRILHFHREDPSSVGARARSAVHVAKQRVELLRQYGIIN